MAKRQVYHVQIVNKGVRCFSNITVMCHILKLKESSMQISARAKATGGYPVIGYSTLAKSRVIITRLAVETRSTESHMEYDALEVSYEIDYIDKANPGLEIMDLRKNKGLL
jgi:hypothetical protein